MNSSSAVLIWGVEKNFNKELDQLLEHSHVVTIDSEDFAKSANHTISLDDSNSLYFALLLARFLIIENLVDSSCFEKFGDEIEEYYELTQSVRIKSSLESMGVTLGDVGYVLQLMHYEQLYIVVGESILESQYATEELQAVDAINILLGKTCVQTLELGFDGQLKKRELENFSFLEEIERR